MFLALFHSFEGDREFFFCLSVPNLIEIRNGDSIHKDGGEVKTGNFFKQFSYFTRSSQALKC